MPFGNSPDFANPIAGPGVIANYLETNSSLGSLSYRRNPATVAAHMGVQRWTSGSAAAFAPRSGASTRGQMSALDLQLKGYRLTTAEIMYHLPDHPKLLQQFVWQDLDLAPKYPVLTKFLNFWSRNLDGRLHSVRVAVCGIITPVEVPYVAHELKVH